MSGATVDSAPVSRLLSLTTALGANAILPVAVRGTEEISATYRITVDAVSEQGAISADAVLYQPACLKIVQGTGAPRIMHGMVRALASSGQPVRGRFSHTLEIVPKLWFMRERSDCRIFTNTTVADIVTTLCGEAGQTLSLRIYGDKPAKPYVTQYNETNFTFFSRLLEEAGYYYFFAHTENDHTLVITDQNQGFPQGALAMQVVHAGGPREVLTEWRKTGNTATGRVELADYDPLNPDTLPDATQSTTLDTAGAAGRNVYGWPAQATTQDEAVANARIRMEAAEAEATLIAASGRNHLLAPGTRITIATDPLDGSVNTEYVIRSVESEGRDSTWVTADGGPQYANRIVVFKASTVWRQGLATPRPSMSGIHTALVLGGDGEEIHADKYGRIKIRFLWDHRRDATADSTCWVRVIQPWSGNTWGWQHLPRVGTEVAVAFLEGDPDRPVVIGGFYNGSMMPVFPIPDEQTKSGFRSRSTAGGSTSTCSELYFDDKSGAEVVFLHAERDMTVEVENDQKTEVKHDQAITVENNRSLTVKQKETIEVDDSQTVTIKNGRTTEVTTSGDKLTVKSGDLTINVSSGSIKMSALQSIELTVGSNSVKIDPAGVTISAMKITLSGTAMVQIKAPMTQVNADGMLMLKGGIMMLN